MSIATMNWALQQRLESPLHQILLYVIADSAAPDGTTRHCDPDYLVERSRMSRATVFRKMADLRALGLVETFTRHGERGEQIYEVRLNIQKMVDIPLKARKSTDGDGESHSETAPETGQDAKIQSHSETVPQSHTATAVAPVRPGQSHSCDRICPPSSKDSPPNPPPGGLEPDSSGQGSAQPEPEHFAEFRRDYPQSSVWSWHKVLPIFAALTPAEREQARAAAPLYARQCLSPKAPKPKRPDGWLRERMWENFPGARIVEAQAPCERVWIPESRCAGLQVAHTLADAEFRMDWNDDHTERGKWRRGPLPEDLRALTGVDVRDQTGWFEAILGTPEFAAWRDRLKAWTGFEPRTAKIWLEPHNPAVHGLPATHPDFKLRRGQDGIRVPWRWPPRKDGSLISDSEGGEGERDA